MTHATHRWNLVGQLLLVSLSVVAATVLLLSSAPIPAADAAPHIQLTPTASPYAAEALLDLPPLPAKIVANVRRVYSDGIAQGNDPDRFILIGDSNNEKPRFLRSFSYGNYDLGAYTYLQPLIDAYNETGAFGAHYPSSEHGMTLNMLMDPAFVDPAICPQAAHLLDCAIQLYRPSIAIVYMGTYDTCNTPFDVYLENFHSAMQFLTAHGVIAILTTYTVALDIGCWESTPAYTGVIRDMASIYRMPLIDLPGYVQSLPAQGMEPDGWHLSYPADFHTSFAGGEALYGNTQRELLTLQMLYLLRRDIGVGLP
jgi:hypothetical protein